MKGSYWYHISLTSLTKPEGLHRTFYQLLPSKKDEFLNTNDDEVWNSCFKKIIYRYNRNNRRVPLRKRWGLFIYEN